MKDLFAGVRHFRQNVYRNQKELFEELAKGQSPQTLFITCSDSRIDPNLITHTDPGDLFVIRNAGNLIPAFGMATGGGEEATIEFAITALGCKHIVICGHSACGAMKGLLSPESLTEMPSVANWLRHAEATRRLVKVKYPTLTEDDLLRAATEENVLTQIENLQTHPAVAVAMARDELSIHAWVYDIPTGDVHSYDVGEGRFVPLADNVRPASGNTPRRVFDVRGGDALFGAKKS
jgi:carbonic anhydrase